MANLNIKSTSRYKSLYGDNWNSDDAFIYNIPPSEIISEDDIIYIFKDVDSVRSLADKYFNDPRYWWIIADINNKQNQYDFEVGEEIRIPRNSTDVIMRMRNYIQKQV